MTSTISTRHELAKQLAKAVEVYLVSHRARLDFGVAGVPCERTSKLATEWVIVDEQRPNAGRRIWQTDTHTKAAAEWP